MAAILTAACEIASTEGLEALSMRRLASAVGMSKSGLYAHFASKEALQLATIERFREVFEAKVVHDDGNGGLDALVARWLAFFENRVFPGGCFVLTAAVDHASRPGPVRDALEAAVDREIMVLETAIHRANEAGELSPPRDATQTAFELHSIMLGANALFQLKEDPALFERARATIHRLVGDRDGSR